MNLALPPRRVLTSRDPSYWLRPRGATTIPAPRYAGPWRVLLPSLGAVASPLVTSMAQAIAQMEGYNTQGTIAAKNNNPGNLRAGAGQVGTANGFAVFPDPATGWNALYSQIDYNIGLGLNMQQFFAGEPGVYPGYAPSADSNNPTAYANFVATQVGVDPTVPLNQAQSGASAGGAWGPSSLPADFPVDLLSDPTYSLGAADATNWTPYIVAAVAVLAVVSIARN